MLSNTGEDGEMCRHKGSFSDLVARIPSELLIHDLGDGDGMRDRSIKHAFPPLGELVNRDCEVVNAATYRSNGLVHSG